MPLNLFDALVQVGDILWDVPTEAEVTLAQYERCLLRVIEIKLGRILYFATSASLHIADNSFRPAPNTFRILYRELECGRQLADRPPETERQRDFPQKLPKQAIQPSPRLSSREIN